MYMYLLSIFLPTSSVVVQYAKRFILSLKPPEVLQLTASYCCNPDCGRCILCHHVLSKAEMFMWHAVLMAVHSH